MHADLLFKICELYIINFVDEIISQIILNIKLTVYLI